MVDELRGGPGYLLPLAGLLACLGGVWVSHVVGISLRTAAKVGFPLMFLFAILGYVVYRIQQLRAVGQRNPEIREYLEDR